MGMCLTIYHLGADEDDDAAITLHNHPDFMELVGNALQAVGEWRIGRYDDWILETEHLQHLQRELEALAAAHGARPMTRAAIRAVLDGWEPEDPWAVIAAYLYVVDVALDWVDQQRFVACTIG